MSKTEMVNLTYNWQETDPLAVEVAKPITHVSIEFEPHGKPMYITLWRPDGSGLRVHSEVREIAERMEIGVLCFAIFKFPSVREVILPIPPGFDQQIDAFKLVACEAGVRAESGIVLRAMNGSEIIIIAAAFPFMLAIDGVVERAHIFEPEYPLDSYMRAAF